MASRQRPWACGGPQRRVANRPKEDKRNERRMLILQNKSLLVVRNSRERSLDPRSEVDDDKGVSADVSGAGFLSEPVTSSRFSSPFPSFFVCY